MRQIMQIIQTKIDNLIEGLRQIRHKYSGKFCNDPLPARKNLDKLRLVSSSDLQQSLRESSETRSEETFSVEMVRKIMKAGSSGDE